MKNQALKLTEAYVKDNLLHIEGNVYDHLITDAEMSDNGYFFYLTDEEIEAYENKPSERARLEDEVENFLKDNFDFDITFDVHFDDEDSSNSKGFEATYQECKDYIETYIGTDESYFADYKGGAVSIVCNYNGITYFENTIKK